MKKDRCHAAAVVVALLLSGSAFAQVDLAITSQSVNPSSITLGTGNMQYTVNLFNFSGTAATNATFTSNLPASSTFVSATPTGAGGSCSGTGPVTCTWPTYPSGSSFSVTITVTPGVAGANTLSSSITANESDPVPGNNSGNATITVNDQIDLAVTNITDSPSDITLGTGNVQYFINLFNYSSSKATNAQLSITLPVSSTFVSATPTGAGGSCTGTGPVTCTWPDYPSGSSFSVTVTVTPGVAGTNTLSATISATQPDPDNVTAGHLNSDTENTTVNDQIDLAVTNITDSPSDITLGTGNVQYFINLFNYSSSKATNAQLAITLPVSSTFVSATPTGAGGSCTGTGPVTCTWPDYPSGSSFSVTVTVTPGIAGVNTLSATISADQPDPDNVTAGHNVTDSEQTTVNDQIDLAVTNITDSPNDITLGTGNVQYFINLFNYSSSKATNAQLSITLPTSSTFVSATPTGAGGSCSGTGPVTCTWPDYPSGSSFSVTVTVTPGVAGVNTLSATLSATQPDPDNVTAGHNVTDSETTTVNDQIDLAVTNITDSPNDITLGTGNVQYFINLFNYSTSKATNAQLSITLPTSSTFVSATPTGAGGSCSGTGPVTCTWPDYPSGSSFSVTVTVTPGVAGTNTLSATLSATQPDPDNATAGHNVTDSETTTVNDQIDLAITNISDSPDPRTLGAGNVQYFINLFNYSTSKATNAQLSITLPASSGFVSATPTGAGGSCSGTGPVSCTWPDYPSGSSFSVTVTVTPGVAGTNTLSATLSATQPDPDNVTAGHNVTDTESTLINPSSAPTITGFTPGSGAVNAPVTINGANFTGTTSVKFFNNVSAAFTVVNDSTITTNVPTGATSGVISVTNGIGTTSSASSFTVNTGIVVINTNDSGSGSLRDAIAQANSGACPSPCTIAFSIGSGLQTITPFSPFSNITASNVTLDATTQPGYSGTPLIELNGVSAGASARGLTLAGNGATVKGLVIRGYTAAFPFGYAIYITGANNTVKSNYLGTNAGGSSASPNRVGIVIETASAAGNTIGGLTAADRNVISGNNASGISIETNAGNNTVVGNYIGTDATGSFSLGNAFNGVNIEGASNNIIGGTSAAARNIISASGGANVNIWFSSSGNSVHGNYIGTNAAGTASLANGAAGVNIEGSSTGNFVGGISAGAGNLVSGNNSHGIVIDGTGTNGNVVQGNVVGLNAAGNTAIPNLFAGVAITGGAQNNTVGGTSASARNILSGNTTQGVAIRDSGTSNNVVQGNYIGLNSSGSTVVGNATTGVGIWNGASNNTIGGTSAAARNIISGNQQDAIAIRDAGTSGNTVAGNYIGTDPTGSFAMANNWYGVDIFSSATGNTIGGATAASMNLISGNSLGGILITDAGTATNAVKSNMIGLNAASSGPIANGGPGVLINTSAASNTIGVPGAGNKIAFNTKGVVLSTTAGIGNRISGNAIAQNTTIGIDLKNDGITANDANDSDTGANNLQNFPLLSNANLAAGTSLDFNVTIDSSGSSPSLGLIFELFKADTSSPEQGLTYLGSTACAGPTFSNTTFNMTVAGVVPGNKIVATATSYTDNTCTTIKDGTSEFSAAVTVAQAQAALSITKSAPAGVAAGEAFTYTLQVKNVGPYPAENVSVSDTLPAGLGWSSTSAPGFTCSAPPSIVCTAASYPVGISNITFNVTAPASPTTVNNTATISATNDSTSGDDSDTAITSVTAASANIGVTKSPNAGTIAVNGSVTYTVVVTNAGPSPATGVVLNDPLPPGQTATTANSTQGSCTTGTNVTCTIGSMANGASVTITIVVTAAAGGTHVNTATATRNEADPNPSNDSASATVTVTGASAMIVTTSADSGNGSLRQAILDANSAVCATPCSINFAISPLLPIVLTSALPSITAQTSINGQTQPGFSGTPLVHLDGSSCGACTGLTFNASQSYLRAVEISGFSGPGVVVTGATGVRMLENSIYSNGFGIDLNNDGATANDTGDPDTGGNNLQNKPVLNSVILGGGNLFFDFSVDSTSVLATNSLRVDFYKADASGQGKEWLGYGCYLGVRTLTNQTLTMSAGTATAGTPFVATATSYSDSSCGSPSDGTSEFSAVTNAVNCTPPSATITAPASTCPASNNAASVPFTAGATYAWSIINGSITGGAGTNAITFTAGASGSTTLNVTVTHNGCASNGSSAVVITPNPTAAVSGSANICAGGSTTINASLTGTAPFNITWSDGFTQVVSSGTTASRVVNPATTTTYTITTLSDANCSGSSSGSAVVTVNPLPTATVSGGGSYCTSGSATISATFTGAAPFTFTWSDGVSQTTGSTSVSRTVSPASTTVYTITSFTDANCSAAASGSATVTVNSPPTPNITGPAAACPSSPVTLNAGAGFVSYLWSTGATTQTISVSPASTTVYSVTVTDGNGCTGSDTHTVTVTPNPSATITAPSSVCASSTGNTASVPAGASSYVWTITGGTITAGAGTNSITFSANASGSVVLGVTVTNGSCTSNGSSTIPINPPPSVTISGPTNACTGSPITLSVPAVYSSYLWSNGQTTPSITVTQFSTVQTYSIVVTNGSGCSATDSHTVTLNASPSAAITAPASVDPLSTGNNANVPAQAGATYTWTIVNGAITAGAATNSITFSAGNSGAVTLGVTVTQSGCASNGTASVPIGSPAPQEADFAITKSAPPAVQAGASLTYTIVVRNNGPVGAAGTMIDTLPAGVALTNVSGGSWNCNPTATQVPCSGFLDIGATNTITITVNAPQQPGTITNNAIVDTTLTDPNASNNAASATTDVAGGSDPCASLSQAAIIQPANNANLTNGLLLIQWTPAANASAYEVWLSFEDGAPSLIGTTSSSSFDYVLSQAGSYSLFIRALRNQCSRDSQSVNFTYTPPAQCASNQAAILISPLDGDTSVAPQFRWSPRNGATKYELFVIRGNSAPQLVTTTTVPFTNVSLATGSLRWFVRTHFAQPCSPEDSEQRDLEIVSAPEACTELAPPVISMPGEISGGIPFIIQWTERPGATAYELQLADNASFTNAPTISTSGTSSSMTAPASGAVYARVRAIDSRCQPPIVSAYGPASAIFVLTPQSTTGNVPLNDPIDVHYAITLGPDFAGQSFAAVPTEPWLSVAPASGIVAATGTTLDVVAHSAALGVGGHSGAIRVTFGSSSRLTTHATSVSPTVNVNLVTPVKPVVSNTPSADTMIIPAVANADGINAHFQSDVRVANTSPQLIKYQLTFIPSGDAGTSQGRQTTFSIEPGQTVALDDVLKSWFGTGSSNATGVLQIKPLTTTTSTTPTTSFGPLANLVSFASSRTFNVTPNGTFGTYVPAVPFANYSGKSSVLSLQQIAQSARFRSNLGLHEGSGSPADVLIKVFGGNGQLVTQFTTKLNGGQHTQLNSFLFERGITLQDGRVEVSVTSNTGKITAYASVLDNETSDAVLVTPVTLGEQGNTKWVIPGVADIKSGFADWQSDVRIFNADTQPADITASFYSQGGGEPKVTSITLAPGEVRQLDKVLPTLFGITGDGGALHLTTSKAARIIATARTYNQTTNGTYGQFISAVTPAEAAGVGTRPLQLLQVEESPRMRSNIGFVNVTDKPVQLAVTITPPDAKFTASLDLTLAPNEYRQMNSLLASLGLGDTYNARISVRAVSGEGRATVFGSMIDLATNDPLYIQGQ